MRRRDEMTQAEALKHKYRSGRVPFTNPETNNRQYMYVFSFSPYRNFQYFCLHRDAWVCDCINVTYPAIFDYGYPPIVIVNIKPLSKRGDEGYNPNPVRLRDVKRILQIGPFE